MNDVEDRLRDALTASAYAAGEPAMAPAPSVRRSRRVRAFVPIAVAAAVVAIAVASVTVLHRSSPRPRPAAPASSPAAYFVTYGDSAQGAQVQIHDAGTGAVTARFGAPPHMFFEGLSATGDPRTFLFLANDDAKNFRYHTYRLTIGGAGKVAALREIESPQVAAEYSFAASPDGTRIAAPAPGPGTSGAAPAVQVLDLRTQRTVSFVSGDPADRGATTRSFSWDATGRYLSFDLSGTRGHDGTYVLDTAGSHDLRAAHLVTRTTGLQPLLSADGRHLYVSDAPTVGGRQVTQVAEIDTATGTHRRVLFSDPEAGPQDSGSLMTALDPSGRVLMAVDTAGRAFRIDVATAHVESFTVQGGATNYLAW